MAQLSTSANSFLYDQVARLVTGMIDSGTLKNGDRIPSLRKMSKQLKVSIATVMQAYLMLEEQGLVEARPQSGFYVKSRLSSECSIPKASNPKSQPRKVKLCEMVETIFDSARDPRIVPLGFANPAPELLPTKGLARAMAQVASRYSVEAVDYCFSPGSFELRRQIAYRNIGLGCELGPDDVVITTGATEALGVALRAVARPGDVIAVESPTYFSILQLIESLGMLAVEVRTDSDTGMCIDSLEKVLNEVQVKAVISVANFSNPTGSLMPDASKARMVEMLGKRGIPLIEDDIGGDVYYGETRPRIAKSFDTQGLVLTCSSFSKTLAPGYRVGWILPGRYKQEVIRAKLTHTSASPSLPQFAIAEFLRTGNYDRHLKRLRKSYREQMDRMRAAVAESFPKGTRITKPQGGIVLWIELPRGVDSTELFHLALAQGVSITPGPLFSPTLKFRNYIRISCGHPWSARVQQAVQTLGSLVEQMALVGSNERLTQTTAAAKEMSTA